MLVAATRTRYLCDMAQGYHHFDLFIAGRGNAARLAALACAAAGFKVGLDRRALIGVDVAPVASGDPMFYARVLALGVTNCAVLEGLGVLSRLHRRPEPVCEMQVGEGPSDGRATAGGFIFEAGAGADQPLALIVSLADLGAALSAQLAAVASTTQSIVPCDAPEDARAMGHLPFVNLEGRTSRLREKAGLGVRISPYGHGALVARLGHDLPHGGVARQFYIDGGPLAVLPLPVLDGKPASALVWSQPEKLANARAAQKPARLAAEITALTGGALGAVSVESPCEVQRLELLMAPRFVVDNHILLGESAHVVHPMAGQGFNLTMRDISALVETLKKARHLGLALDDASLLAALGATRKADALRVAGLTDGLFHLFAAGQALAPLRAAGLDAFGRMDGLRAALAAQANG